MKTLNDLSKDLKSGKINKEQYEEMVEEMKSSPSSVDVQELISDIKSGKISREQYEEMEKTGEIRLNIIDYSILTGECYRELGINLLITPVEKIRRSNNIWKNELPLDSEELKEHPPDNP